MTLSFLEALLAKRLSPAELRKPGARHGGVPEEPDRHGFAHASMRHIGQGYSFLHRMREDTRLMGEWFRDRRSPHDDR